MDEIECPACKRKLLLPEGIRIAGSRCAGCDFVFPGRPHREAKVADNYDAAVSMNDPPPPAQDPKAEEEPTLEEKKVLYSKEIAKFRDQMRDMDDGSESTWFNRWILAWLLSGFLFGLVPLLFDILNLARIHRVDVLGVAALNGILWAIAAYWFGEPWFRRDGQQATSIARVVLVSQLAVHAACWSLMYMDRVECKTGTPLLQTFWIASSFFVLIQLVQLPSRFAKAPELASRAERHLYEPDGEQADLTRSESNE